MEKPAFKNILTYNALLALNRINTLLIRTSNKLQLYQEIGKILTEYLTFDTIHIYTCHNRDNAELVSFRGELYCPECHEKRNQLRFKNNPLIIEEIMQLGNTPALLNMLPCPFCKKDTFRPAIITPLVSKNHLEAFIIAVKNPESGPIDPDMFLFEELAINYSHQICRIEKNHASRSYQLLLSEKELLLKELNHRVKNNLQVIHSLLNMQSRYVTGESNSTLLTECQNRVKSMAMVHENLYMTGTPGKIQFAAYIKKLADHLVRSYGFDQQDIEIDINLGNIQFDMDTAIYCGLIINELISNSLKYAFSDMTGGKIEISLEGAAEENIQLIIRDNGRGIDTVHMKKMNTMGLQLVKDISHQLGGQFRIMKDNGTRAVILIRKPVSMETDSSRPQSP